MSCPKDSNTSYLQSWMQVKKAGITPPELEFKPKLSSDAFTFWNLFQDIARSCKKITYSELNAYEQVTQVSLGSWEIEGIMRLDSIRQNPPKWRKDACYN